MSTRYYVQYRLPHKHYSKTYQSGVRMFEQFSIAQGFYDEMCKTATKVRLRIVVDLKEYGEWKEVLPMGKARLGGVG